MKIIIEVKTTDVQQRTARGKDGKDYHFRDQEAWADLGKAYPLQVRISLDQDQGPYAPGRYELAHESLYVDRFRQLKLGRPRLVPAV